MTKVIELKPDPAKDWLKKCEHRMSTSTSDASWPLQVKYHNQWLDVCRTDMKNNVTTGDGSIKTIADAVSRCVYGVRINTNENYLAVIDRRTDG